MADVEFVEHHQTMGGQRRQSCRLSAQMGDMHVPGGDKNGLGRSYQVALTVEEYRRLHNTERTDA